MDHFFLLALPLTVSWSAFYWLCPTSLSWEMIILEAPEKSRDLVGLCLCDKMLADQYKKFKSLSFPFRQVP